MVCQQARTCDPDGCHAQHPALNYQLFSASTTTLLVSLI